MKLTNAEISLTHVQTSLPESSLSLSGLQQGYAIIGTHGAISGVMSGSETITAFRWGSTPGGSEYGTATNPVDFAQGEGSTLHLTTTSAGTDLVTSAEIRHAAPNAAGGLADQTFTSNTGIHSYDVSEDFTFPGTGTFSLQTSPSGVTIDPTNGLVNFDTDVMGVQSAASIIIRLSDSIDPSRFVDSAFSLTISGAAGAARIAFSGFSEASNDLQIETDQLSDGVFTGPEAHKLKHLALIILVVGRAVSSLKAGSSQYLLPEVFLIFRQPGMARRGCMYTSAIPAELTAIWCFRISSMITRHLDCSV